MTFKPNPTPLSQSEQIDLLRANQTELQRAHNELVGMVESLSRRLGEALVLLSATLPGEPDLPAREPFAKRHGKRH